MFIVIVAAEHDGQHKAFAGDSAQLTSFWHFPVRLHARRGGTGFQ